MFRLLEVKDDGVLGFREVEDESSIPSYAILSHTWAAKSEELSYEDVLQGKNQESSGYEKVQFCLRQALDDGLRYCWVDTCCVDKSSSAELSEAIVSMYRWHQDAAKCYVYLSDVDDETDPSKQGSAFRRSRWFTRGWTLQELLAPRTLEFFSSNATKIGSKTALCQEVHEITNIPVEALKGKDLSSFSVKERMSWVGSRRTSRGENAAYCLLGIFDITLVPVYGEGQALAFRRLKQEIRQRSYFGHSPDSELGHLHDSDESDEALPAKKPKVKNERAVSDEEMKALLDSLRFHEIEVRRLTIKSAHVKTCDWLLQDEQYVEWLDDRKRHEHNGFL